MLLSSDADSTKEKRGCSSSSHISHLCQVPVDTFECAAIALAIVSVEEEEARNVKWVNEREREKKSYRTPNKSESAALNFVPYSSTHNRAQKNRSIHTSQGEREGEEEFGAENKNKCEEKKS